MLPRRGGRDLRFVVRSASLEVARERINSGHRDRVTMCVNTTISGGSEPLRREVLVPRSRCGCEVVREKHGGLRESIHVGVVRDARTLVS